MSFSYTYPTSSQLLMTGQHPVNSCCDTLSPDSQSPVYDSRLLTTYPRLTAVNGFYGASYTDQSGYVALGANPPAFYPTLPSPYDLKESRGTWGTLPQAAACYPYDPSLAAAYGDRYGAIDNAARRKNATRETTNTLKAWLFEHRKNPYPTKGEKIMLAIITKMTLTQVSTWFANARRRLKKENKMTWEPRNKTGDNADDSGDDDGSDIEKKEVKQEKIEECRLEDDKCFSKSPDTSSSHSSSVQSPLSERPKIWSLAHTATSSSPPILRTAVKTSDRYPTMGQWLNGSPVGSESGESLVLSNPLRPSALPSSASPCYRDPPALIRMTDNGLISDRKSSQSLTPSSGGPTAFKPLSRSSL